MSKHTMKMIYSALVCAVTALCAQIVLPIGAIPINLGLVGVCLAGGLLPVRYAMLCQSVYVLLGAVGLPVFAGFGAGVGVLAGPTGGYLIGYIVAAGLIARLCANARRFWRLSAAMAAGVAVCYGLGTAWFAWSTKTTVCSATAICVLPFLPLDICKISLAAIITTRLRCKTLPIGQR